MEQITIVYGTEQVNKLERGETLTKDEQLEYTHSYSFETVAELNAFLYGMNEVIGWNKFKILEE